MEIEKKRKGTLDSMSLRTLILMWLGAMVGAGLGGATFLKSSWPLSSWEWVMVRGAFVAPMIGISLTYGVLAVICTAKVTDGSGPMKVWVPEIQLTRIVARDSQGNVIDQR